MQQTRITRLLWHLFGLWVLANTVGWFLIFAPFGMVPFRTGVEIRAEGWLLLVIGAVLGLFQWLVLRIYIPLPGWWIPINIVAWTMSWLVAALTLALVGEALLWPVQVVSVPLARFVGGILFEALRGLIIGSLQWLAFHDWLQRSHWWIPASAAGLGMASFTRQTTAAALSYGLDMSWFVYSVVTGIALMWIMQDPNVFDMSYITGEDDHV